MDGLWLAVQQAQILMQTCYDRSQLAVTKHKTRLYRSVLLRQERKKLTWCQLFPLETSSSRSSTLEGALLKGEAAGALTALKGENTTAFLAVVPSALRG